MRVWSLFRKIIPVLVIAAMLSSFISVIPVAAAGAAKVVFGQAPVNTIAGAVITPPVTVLIEDVDGNLIATSTASVTLTIGTNPSAGILGGTVTRAAVAGVATFNNLTIDKPGTGYTLVASSGTLDPATSGAFNITIGAAEKLIFSTPPAATTTAGATMAAIVVTVQDHYNNTVVTSNAPMIKRQ